jgi:hypothetical protein
VCSITPPRQNGLDTVDTIKGMLDGQVKVFVSMGGSVFGCMPELNVLCAIIVEVTPAAL